MIETLEQLAKLAPAILVPITAIGVLVSLYIGISTLREVRFSRQQSIRPFCLFASGAQMVPVDLVDREGVPGIDFDFARGLTEGRPPGKNRAQFWGRLYNHGLGPAIGIEICFIPYRVFLGKDVFVIDEQKHNSGVSITSCSRKGRNIWETFNSGRRRL
jgi:hypothetical protein